MTPTELTSTLAEIQAACEDKANSGEASQFEQFAALAIRTSIESLKAHYEYLCECECVCKMANEDRERDICNRCMALAQLEISLQTICEQWRARG